ncbi:MAG: hypothetical protein ACKPKO_26840 [Candidatus Fonsibacter sp.]
MWSTDNIHQDKLADQLSTMEQRPPPHERPVLTAKGHMQYTWFRSKSEKSKLQSKMNI